jgi:hypothetical protein
VTVTHANAYGAQAQACPHHVEEPFAPTPCGVDPFTLSGTTFDRESGFNTYTITVSNTGSAPTTLPATLEDHLPPGIVLAGTTETGRPGEETADVVSGPGWECHVIRGADGLSGATSVACIELSPLAEGHSYPPITLHVYVKREAGALVQNEVTVSGGGAPSETVRDRPPTAIASVPFGIQSFQTRSEEPQPSAENKAAGEVEPSTQAGGHPVSLTTSFVLNSIPSVLGELGGAGGGPKEVQVHLPPGLVGNPQDVANPPSAGECPLQLLHPSRQVAGNPELIEEPCSLWRDGHLVQQGTNDVVGYVAIYSERQIVSGKLAPLAGEKTASLEDGELESSPIYNLKPSPGHPAEFGFFDLGSIPFVLDAKLRSGGDYGVTVGDRAAGPVLGVRATFCGYGVKEESLGKKRVKYVCNSPAPGQRPFLTNPTKCIGPAPLTTLLASSWAEAGQARNEELQRGEPVEVPFASTGSYSGAPSAGPSFAGQPGTSATPVESSFVTGCDKLSFEPQLSLQPTTTQADAPTGLTVNLKVPHTNEPVRRHFNEGKEEVSAPNSPPALKSSVIALPEGMSISPAGADGLQACTDSQFGLTEYEAHGVSPPPGRPERQANPARCPAASQIGTVKVTTPLLGEPLEGQVFVGQPECAGPGGVCTEATKDASAGRIFRLFLQVQDPAAGVIVKLVGRTFADEATGRLKTVFENQPQTPFEALELKLKDGATASLQNPQSCGPTSLYADFTPWSEPGLGGPAGNENIPGSPDTVFEEPAFTVTGCNPALFGVAADPPLEAGTENTQAAHYSPFSLTLARDDGEQNLQSVKVQMPAGLTAKIAGVPQCPEAQANAGSCPPETRIGTATAGAGPGPHPFYEQGPVYFTGPYRGAPFGLSIVIPARAGPFDLGQIVVRQAISVDKNTTAASVTSDPMPQIHDGVPLRIKKINVALDYPNFTLNPTDCSRKTIGATLTSTVGQTAQVSSPYQAQGCQNLAFHPSLTASTQAKTSKALGASLSVKVSAKPGEANIRKTELIIPPILPSRLTTLQKACTDAAFSRDPASCPEGSVIGLAKAKTPLLSGELSGPAILVSHGGAAFPDVIFVLQGDGIRLDLDGGTDIKGQVTYSKFESVPDQPVESFETVLPEGPHSVLTANGNLCTAKISIPTTITAQNGARITQNTPVVVTGCPKPLSNAQKLAAALKACKKKPKRQQKACERAARKAYASAARKAKKAKKAKKATARASSASQTAAPASQGASPGAIPAVAGATMATGSARAAVAAADPGPCENEPLREESNINPATGRPYSTQLPECRAYEMVSPLEKQAHGVFGRAEGFPVAPNGDAVGFDSEGDFAEPLNFTIEGFTPFNVFISNRTPTGWTTKSAFAPANLVRNPSLGGLQGDFTPDMSSARASCGEPQADREFACALSESGGAWTSTPLYTSNVGTGVGAAEDYLGASSSPPFSRLFIQPGGHLLPEDTARVGLAGIYEIAGPATPSPELRLVNVGNQSGTEKEGELKIGTQGALLGDSRQGAGTEVHGTAYHAISEDGQRVFFSATPTAQQLPAGEQQTIYARVACASGPECVYAENDEGMVAGTGRETVAVSNPSPSECATCTKVKRTPEEEEQGVEPEAATFQGASSNGEKVFFTTRQQLLGSDKDEASDLYEYDFRNPTEEPLGERLPAAVGKHLVQLSFGSGEEGTTKGTGAEVQGVVRTSSDGTHVFFVAKGVLTKVPNANGQEAIAGADNLYAVDTTSGETRFVGVLAAQDSALWGEGTGVLTLECKPKKPEELGCDDTSREAQTTPDGNYLVFSTYAQLAPEEPRRAAPVQAVYRYDFETGRLTWVSHGAPGFTPGQNCTKQDECQNAIIAPLNGQRLGASVGGADWGRAISNNEEGEHDGESIVFTTSEKLQQDDLNEKPDVYLWHCSAECARRGEKGSVAMISDGRDPQGVDLTPARQPASPGMSASGSDIFFTTGTQLVGQDSDELVDLYDARIGGGFPRPPALSSCFQEGERERSCQEEFPEQRELRAKVFGPLASMTLGSSGNLIAPQPASASSGPPGPSFSLTAVRLKGNILLVTVRTGEKGAITISGRGLRRTSKTLAGGTHRVEVPLTVAGRNSRRRHGKTELQATLRVGTDTATRTLAVRL